MTLTWVTTSMNQWQRSWIGGKQSRRTSTVTTNGNFSTVCYFSGCNDREVIPGRTCAIESNHVREKVKTPFARTGVDKWSNHNRGYNILLTYDPQISFTQSPAGQVAGRIGLAGLNARPRNNTHKAKNASTPTMS